MTFVPVVNSFEFRERNSQFERIQQSKRDESILFSWNFSMTKFHEIFSPRIWLNFPINLFSFQLSRIINPIKRFYSRFDSHLPAFNVSRPSTFTHFQNRTQLYRVSVQQVARILRMMGYSLNWLIFHLSKNKFRRRRVVHPPKWCLGARFRDFFRKRL